MHFPSLFRRLPVLASVVWLASSIVLQAQVTVDFSHSNGAVGSPAAGSGTQNTGDITLAFTVDGAGNVTLDASCTDPDPVTYVDEFDGLVGTVSDPAMWGQSFSIELSETGSGTLRIDNTGSGLAAGGGNAQIIDANSSGINETITATVTASGADFLLQSVNYTGLSNGGIALNSTPYTPSGSSGTVDVSAQGVDETFSIESSVSTVGQGFKLSGFTFDLVPTASDVVVSFANSGTGFTNFVTPGSASATITLDFSIDGAGVIALDASTSSTDTVFQATVDEWDNASAGSVSDAALLGQSFTLVGSPSGGNGNLTITEKIGGGIGISGENGNRVDGKDYGADLSTPETLTWTLTAPAGVALNLTNWSHADGNNGDIEVSNGSVDNDFPNLSSSGRYERTERYHSGRWRFVDLPRNPRHRLDHWRRHRRFLFLRHCGFQQPVDQSIELESERSACRSGRCDHQRLRCDSR